MSPVSSTTQLNNARHSRRNTGATSRAKSWGAKRACWLLACALCLLALVVPPREVQCGRLQDFIQNLVGGAGSSSASQGNKNSNSNANSNSNSNSNNNNENSDNNSNEADTAASNESSEQNALTPMMSAMNPFMRYPSFYDGFGASFGAGYPGMSSFSGNMGAAMSALSPMAMSGSGGSPLASFSPASFSPAASFASAFGGSPSGGGASNPFGSYATGAHSPGAHNGLGAASSLSNVYAASSPAAFMGGYTPYYGRR